MDKLPSDAATILRDRYGSDDVEWRASLEDAKIEADREQKMFDWLCIARTYIQQALQARYKDVTAMHRADAAVLKVTNIIEGNEDEDVS